MRYRLKLTITIALLIAISFGIGGTLMITTSFNATLKQETQAALQSFESVQNTLFLLNSLGDQTDFNGLSDALTQMESQGMGQWQALSLRTEEQEIYRDGVISENTYDIGIPEQGQCTYTAVADDNGHGLVVMSILWAGDMELTLLARFDVSHVYAIRAEQQKQYMVIYTAVVLFGVVAAAFFSYALTRHLHRLTVTARKISDGDLSSRSRIVSKDEFGDLSRNFDAMADKLQENIHRLEDDMRRQENFMGAFAHELKTPMTSIIGFADLLRQGSLDESTRITAAEYIHSEGRRLERLSFKLLELLLLQRDAMVMKQVRLGSFIREVEQALEPVMDQKGIRLTCNAEQGQTVLEPDLVKSLLYNLVDNASKAMEGGGVITLDASLIPGGCQFQVTDNGRGMAPEELERITEAFYRVDKARSRSQGGAGLGLSLCKQIAELHGGTISFASEPGKGTCVTVKLYGKAGDGDA